MRKFILMMATAFVVAVSANAQTAVETQKTFDNVYVTVQGGVATPMDLNVAFPLNATAGASVGKQFTPVWGAEVEGTVWFGSHANGSHIGGAPHFDGMEHTFVRGSYVGVNGTINLTNLFKGYNGTPRFFEVSTVLGTGWWHVYVPKSQSDDFNGLGVKTGLDLAFNLGKDKAHTLSIRPAVLWNVNRPSGGGGEAFKYLTFDKRNAQLQLGVAYTYHFGTSNGTRHFKTYDIAAMEATIARLNAELAKKPKVVEKIVIKEVVKEVPVTTEAATEKTVYFKFDSAELSNDAKTTLNTVGENAVVDIEGFASNEGDAEYNVQLSQRRADVVAKYLQGRGVKVNSAKGLGVVGEKSPRAAVVK